LVANIYPNQKENVRLLGDEQISKCVLNRFKLVKVISLYL